MILILLLLRLQHAAAHGSIGYYYNPSVGYQVSFHEEPVLTLSEIFMTYDLLRLPSLSFFFLLLPSSSFFVVLLRRPSSSSFFFLLLPSSSSFVFLLFPSPSFFFLLRRPSSSSHENYQQCNTGRWNNVRPNGSGPFICPSCPAGWYQNSIGQGSCKQCSGGRTSPATSPGPCSNPCGSGKYSNSGSCQNCNAGQYQDQNSQSSCKTCSIGNYCTSGSSTPTQCPAGVIGSTTGLSTSTCSAACPLGKYQYEESGLSEVEIR